MFENINVNDRVEISVLYRTGENQPLQSYVKEIISDSEVMVEKPTSYDASGKNLQIIFFTLRGLYEFNARLQEVVIKDGCTLLKIKLTTTGKRAERREYFRAKIALPLKFSILKKKEKEQEKEQEKEKNPIGVTLAGEIQDISAGGIRFISKEDVDEGDMIRSDFSLNGKNISLAGQILTKKEVVKGDHQYEYRVEFAGVTPKSESEIIRLLAEQQLKVPKKSQLQTPKVEQVKKAEVLENPKPLIVSIDDMAEMLASLSEMLSGQYRVIGVKSYFEAMEVLERYTPVLFLLDIDMPTFDGYDIASIIRADERFEITPIIFLTGRTNRDSFFKAIEKGGNDYILKPVEKTILLQKIQKHLGEANRL